MDSPWQKALAFTLAYEGGYDNDPNDKGGETFRGISRKNWGSWEGWITLDHLKEMIPDNFEISALADTKLTESVESFYRTNFWDEIHGDEFPGKVAVSLFDMAVNSGVGTAVRLLQSVLGVDADGTIGPKTIKAAFDRGENGVVSFLAARIKFLHGIMDNNPTQQVWANNWFRRVMKLANVVLEGQGVEFMEV